MDLLDGTTAYVLAVIEHAPPPDSDPRRDHTPQQRGGHPNGPHLVMDLGGHLESVNLLLRDRDTMFTAVNTVFNAAGSGILRSPIQVPGSNAIMKRWIGGSRRELLDRTFIRSRHHLLHALREYEGHRN